MVVTLHFKDFPEEYELDSGLEGRQVETRNALISIFVDDEGRIVYLGQELVGDRWKGNFEVLEEILRKIKPKGLYNVPEPGLENVPFEKIIEVVKKRILTV